MWEKIIAFSVLIIMSLAQVVSAGYFLPLDTPVRMRDFEIHGFATDNEENIYVMGVDYNEAENRLYIQKFPPKDSMEFGWRDYIRFQPTTPSEIAPEYIDGRDIRFCENGRLYVAGTIGWYDEELERDQQQLFDAVILPTGTIQHERRLGDPYCPWEYDVYDVHIEKSCESIFALIKDRKFRIQRYINGFLRSKMVGFGVAHALTTDDEGNLYIMGKTPSGSEYFLMKYTEQGQYIKGMSEEVDDYFDPEDIVIDKDGTVYTVLTAKVNDCYNAEPEANCRPSWFYIKTFYPDLSERNCYRSTHPNSSYLTTSCRLALSETDIYVASTLARISSLGYTSTSIKVLCYDKELISDDFELLYNGEARISEKKRLPGMFNNNARVYLRENVQLSTNETVDQMVLLVDAAERRTSTIESYWIPKLTEVKIKYHFGVNVFSLPVVPTDIDDINFARNFICIYRWSDGRFIPIVYNKELKPGVGYYALSLYPNSITWKGKEILSLKMHPTGINVIGGCTYPYKLRPTECIIETLFDFDKSTGRTISLEWDSILDPGCGYKIYTDPFSIYSGIEMRVVK